jgi:putative spermidine/putrescine transport system permease protein
VGTIPHFAYFLERSEIPLMRWYLKALGTRKIIEFILLIIFVIFFFAPLLNLVVLAFSGKWSYPDLLPHMWSLKWWTFVFQQEDIAHSISLSFMIATIVTAASIIICVPAAYAFARIRFPLSRFFLFSFLLTHAFPKWAYMFRLRFYFISWD